MEKLTLDDIDTWLLSGKPVVRLQGRDFGQSVHDYIAHVDQTCTAVRLECSVLEIADPPGVVVQAYLPSERAPELEIPLIKVSKTDTPWIFCIHSKCRNRVAVPGSVCDAHQ